MNVNLYHAFPSCCTVRRLLLKGFQITLHVWWPGIALWCMCLVHVFCNETLHWIGLRLGILFNVGKPLARRLLFQAPTVRTT